MKLRRLARSRLWVTAVTVAAWLTPLNTIFGSPTARAYSPTTGGRLLNAGTHSWQEPEDQASPSKAGATNSGANHAARSKPEPERGYAAFYSSSLEGHKTACGGVYSANKLTAAHRNLPCGTKLRVTNLRNGKTVQVTVTDHGPFSNGRILDLSYTAARHLNFIKQGTTLVKVEVLR